MSTKIRIDLKEGIIEAEGSEEFVVKVYNDFKESIQVIESGTKPVNKKKHKNDTDSKPLKDKDTTPKVRRSKQEAPKIVKDLDLSGKSCGTNLKDYHKSFEVKSNYENNLVFSYYLKNIMNIDTINQDHIFTCYRDIKELKIPGNLEQSIRDTRGKKSWLDYETLDDISITVHGTNYIEHDIKHSK